MGVVTVVREGKGGGDAAGEMKNSLSISFKLVFSSEQCYCILRLNYC